MGRDLIYFGEQAMKVKTRQTGLTGYSVEVNSLLEILIDK
jgi:hypothetical protein